MINKRRIVRPVKGDLYNKTISNNVSRLGGYIAAQRFTPGEYNLYETGRIIDTEALVGRAFARKISVVMRHGYVIRSQNKKNEKRIKQRIKELEYVTGTTLYQLVLNIVSDLIHLNNSFVLKVRSSRSSTSQGRDKDPLAALFALPTASIQPKLDEDGNVIQWRQRVTGRVDKLFDRDSISHLFADKRNGLVLGTPPLEAVKDDILALRTIEENVELLIDKSITPLLHAKVGTTDRPASILPDGTTEIDDITYRMRDMEKDGILVTNERVEIRAIGAESLALRVESYLAHFKSRVLMGLGVSSLDLGETSEAGRATGEVLSTNLVDAAKSYQKIVSDFMTSVFTSMLYDDSLIEQEYLITEDDIVYFEFLPVENTDRLKEEAHWVDMYTKNAVSLNEAREKMGLKPYKIDGLFSEIATKTAPKPESTTGTTLTPESPAKGKDKNKIPQSKKVKLDSLESITQSRADVRISEYIASLDIMNGNEHLFDKFINESKIEIFNNLTVDYTESIDKAIVRVLDSNRINQG